MSSFTVAIEEGVDDFEEAEKRVLVSKVLARLLLGTKGLARGESRGAILWIHGV